MFIDLVWMVALIYRAFALCCNVRGVRAVATFIIGPIVVEVLSEVDLSLLRQL
jgi:hypothetical protein